MVEPDGPPRRRPGNVGGVAGGIAGTWPPRRAAQAGGFAPSSLAAWGAFAERLRAWARAEAGAGRLLPWVPVAFGAGIALYFTAFREPALTATLVAAIIFGKDNCEVQGFCVIG